MKTNLVEPNDIYFNQVNRVINLSEVPDDDLSYYKTADYRRLSKGDFTVRYDMKHFVRLACLKVVDSLGDTAYLVMDRMSLDLTIRNGLANKILNGLGPESYDFMRRATLAV